MKRIILWVLASLVLLLGAAALTGAGWLFLVFGSGSTATFDAGRIECSTSRGILIDVAGVSTASINLDQVGQTTLDVSSDVPIFVGASDRDIVDQVLLGQSYCVASGTGPNWDLIDVPGLDEQPFPLALWRYAETAERVNVPIYSEDNVTVLITNADGSVGVSADVAITFTSERISVTTLVSAIVGVVLVLIAIGLGVWAIVTDRRRAPGKHEPAESSASDSPEPVDESAEETEAEAEAETVDESTETPDDSTSREEVEDVVEESVEEPTDEPTGEINIVDQVSEDTDADAPEPGNDDGESKPES